MATTPRAGPGASAPNAHLHPTVERSAPTSAIEAVVSRNPRQIWRVSAVPRYLGSASSVTHAENCALSATTDAPQMTAIASSAAGLAPKKNPTARQHAPETAIAAEATAVRPKRSAAIPAATQPAAPAPITRNDATSARPCGAWRTSRLARIITGTHVHIA